MQKLIVHQAPLFGTPINPSSSSLSASPRLLHHSSPSIQFISSKWSFKSLLNNNVASPALAVNSFPYTASFLRHVSSRKRAKRRKPMTPRTSKIKKIKDNERWNIRRWREGKNHNAHLKSKKSRPRLRQPATVPAAYAKLMKKLDFCA